MEKFKIPNQKATNNIKKHRGNWNYKVTENKYKIVDLGTKQNQAQNLTDGSLGNLSASIQTKVPFS